MEPAYTIRADSGCTLAVKAITGRNQNAASGSDPACLLGSFRSKCRRKTKTKNKQLIVETLYLDLKDLKQSKSDRSGGRKREGGGGGGGGGGGRASYSLLKEPIGCIGPPQRRI